MSAAPYDRRRFRTTTDIVVPAGTLVLPNPDGQATIAVSVDGLRLQVLDQASAVRQGLIRELGDGEA